MKRVKKTISVSDQYRLLFVCLLNFLKIRSAVLAERANEVLGKGVPLIDIAADLADIALFALGLGLRLDVLVIIGVGHGLGIREDLGLADRADKHTVGVKVDVLLYGKRHKGVDVARKHGQAVL